MTPSSPRNWSSTVASLRKASDGRPAGDREAPAHFECYVNLPPASVELIGLDDEARSLADEYVNAGVLGGTSIGDALHVAAATVSGADRAMTILSPREMGDEEGV